MLLEICKQAPNQHSTNLHSLCETYTNSTYLLQNYKPHVQAVWEKENYTIHIGTLHGRRLSIQQVSYT